MVTTWPEGVYPGTGRPYAHDDVLDVLDRIDDTPGWEGAIYQLADELAELLISKQRDYGPRAINDSPGGALNGINVRLHDKLARAVNLSGQAQPKHESLVDTYRDIAGYALIAALVLEGSWPQ